MEISIKGASPLDPSSFSHAPSLRILIVHARWNIEILQHLVDGAKKRLTQVYKVPSENIVIQSVPGSWELPFVTKQLIQQSIQSGNPFDAVISIGVLIKGKTMHFEYISSAVSQGLMNIGLETGVPVVFGVLTCLTEEQAWLRAGVGAHGTGAHNHGEDWADVAVELGSLRK